MKLNDRLPDSVVFRGKRIRLDLDFRNVLQMLETMKRDDLMPEAREYLALKHICRRPKKGMLPVVRALLFPDSGKEAHTRITDFEQDAELIQAAFMQVYGINLFREKLHWFEFMAFLAGLPTGNRYTEILGIRSRPMPPATKYNAEERAWLAKAKSEFAIHLSESEREANYSKSVQQVGRALLAFFGEGGEG